jgi:hypothetical protein
LVAPDIGSLTGSFSGDILAEDGEISALNSSIADIGSSGTPINVRALDQIGYILGTAIYANISGPASDPYSVDINQIYSNGGPFAGSLKMRRFVSGTHGPGITVVGDVLEADVVIKEALLSTADINVPSGGLAGQIIIRAGNNVSHTWNGEVTVGSSVIEPGVSQPNLAPYYRHTHTALGGGAIGLVPFNVNDVDCEPENASTVCEVGTLEWPDESVRETLVIRHYGPVFEVGGALPVIVESVDLACPIPGNCPTWQDISSSCDVLVGPDAAGREVWVSLTPTGSPATPVPFTQVYSYRVTPRTYNDGATRTYLRSDGTGLSTAPNVYSYTYGFTVMCSSP